MNPALVWCPCPDAQCAKNISEHLLAEKLIACANILPGVESVFEWNGECTSANEVAVLFKTTEALVDKVVDRLGQLHPYDTPAILGWGCEKSHPATLAWLQSALDQG